MDWNRLLSKKRLGKENEDGSGWEQSRNSFARDFDRIIFSTPFRRLQSKAQVVPLPEHDFIHTRLTHSLETSSIGRSMGRLVGEELLAGSSSYFRSARLTANDFETVVAAACIAHDIGNPPFGHSGEKSISEYFDAGIGSDYLTGLSKQQQKDLTDFEGNAMGFRILSHSLPAQTAAPGGLGLTYATLGVFMKYPRCSVAGSIEGKASTRKYGYFQSEDEIFCRVTEGLGLKTCKSSQDGHHCRAWHRHPLTFIVEAADDIGYLIIDLEDAYKRGVVSFKDVQDYLFAIFGTNVPDDISVKLGLIHDEKEQIGYLRARVINHLINSISRAFLENLESIGNGNFDQHLIYSIPAGPVLKELADYSRAVIYNTRDVVEVEIAGYEIISGLLDTFLGALFGAGMRSKKIRSLIPDQYLAPGRKNFDDKYESILSIVQFISSMTDSYAVDLYRKIKGVTL